MRHASSKVFSYLHFLSVESYIQGYVQDSEGSALFLGSWIRIHIKIKIQELISEKLDLDPHSNGKLDLDPQPWLQQLYFFFFMTV